MVTYREEGIFATDTVSGSSDVTSFTVDIPQNNVVSILNLQMHFTTETDNFQGRIECLNSGGSVQTVGYNTGTYGTTSNFGGSTSTSIPMNYYNLGAANSTSFTTQEGYRVLMFIHNAFVDFTYPFRHPTIWGHTSYELTSGGTKLANFTIKQKSTMKIASLRFSAQSGNIDYYRATVHPLADG